MAQITKDEIVALISAKIAGQGSAVDVGGALPTILNGIVEILSSDVQSITEKITEEITKLFSELVNIFSGYGDKFIYIDTESKLNVADELPALTNIRELLYVPYNSELSLSGATNMIVAKTENWKLSDYGAIRLFQNCKVKSVDVSTLFASNQPGQCYAMFSGADIEEIYGMDLWDTNMRKTGIGEFCYNCQKLREIDLFPIHTNLSETETDNAFYNCLSLTTIRRSGKISASISFGYSPLTRESALVLLNALDSEHVGTLTLSAATYALLSADDIAIGTNKGWTISHS